MTVTFYSAMMSVLWCSLFIILIYVLLRQERFILRFGIYPVLFLTLLAFVRLLCVFELPFAKTIRSYTVLMTLYDFLHLTPFTFLSDRLIITVSDILLAVWITGAVFSSWKILRQHLRFRRYMEQFSTAPDERVNAAIKDITGSRENGRKVTVRQSPLVDSPFITGYRKPVIYLPDIRLADAELYYILRHELNHYTHKDLWIKLLFEIICAVYWWNPLFVLLKKDLDDSLEIRNDFLLTRKLRESEKKEYLHTILKIASYKRVRKNNNSFPNPRLGLVFHTNGQIVKERFQYVLQKKDKNIAQKSASFCIYLLIGMLFIGSYLFIFQSAGFSEEYYRGDFIEINAENAYLTPDSDGTYSMYVNDQCWETSIADLKPLPYAELNIRY